MCLQNIEYGNEQAVERATTRLRRLVQAGSTDALRAAAARAMRGVTQPDDISFLIDVMMRDLEVKVQTEAFHALPCNYMSPSPLIREQVRAMYAVAVDNTRAAGLRKSCAERALMQLFDESDALSAPEQAALKEMLGKKD